MCSVLQRRNRNKDRISESFMTKNTPNLRLCSSRPSRTPKCLSTCLTSCSIKIPSSNSPVVVASTTLRRRKARLDLKRSTTKPTMRLITCLIKNLRSIQMISYNPLIERRDLIPQTSMVLPLLLIKDFLKRRM